MKRFVFFFLFLALMTLSACDLSTTESNAPTGAASIAPTATTRPTVHAVPLPSGTMTDPTYVEDTEAATCMSWNISINGAKSVQWCTAHMPGRQRGDYILLSITTPGVNEVEYRITAINEQRQSVSVTFVQKWVPNGTLQRPFLLLVYTATCSFWKITFEGVGMDPLCTMTMPALRRGQYVELAGANQSGEFFVQTVDVAAKAAVIG